MARAGNANIDLIVDTHTTASGKAKHAVHERRNAKRFTAPHIRSTIRRGVIANRQKASVARELLDDLSKDVIRNDRNLQLWLANVAANNLRAKLANEATPTPVYTFTPPTPSTDLSNAIRELTALVFAISNDTTVDLPPPPSANATEYATTFRTKKVLGNIQPSSSFVVFCFCVLQQQSIQQRNNNTNNKYNTV